MMGKKTVMMHIDYKYREMVSCEYPAYLNGRSAFTFQ